jgi:hypothetical protein
VSTRTSIIHNFKGNWQAFLTLTQTPLCFAEVCFGKKLTTRKVRWFHPGFERLQQFLKRGSSNSLEYLSFFMNSRGMVFEIAYFRIVENKEILQSKTL